MGRRVRVSRGARGVTYNKPSERISVTRILEFVIFRRIRRIRNAYIVIKKKKRKKRKTDKRNQFFNEKCLFRRMVTRISCGSYELLKKMVIAFSEREARLRKREDFNNVFYRARMQCGVYIILASKYTCNSTFQLVPRNVARNVAYVICLAREWALFLFILMIRQGIF